MGAEVFITPAKGETAKEAFEDAIQDAKHWHGHAGYTGTIAEKTEFIMINPTKKDKEYFENNEEEYIEHLIAQEDYRINNKWGPAGCIKLFDKENTYLFFGWASS